MAEDMNKKEISDEPILDVVVQTPVVAVGVAGGNHQPSGIKKTVEKQEGKKGKEPKRKMKAKDVPFIVLLTFLAVMFISPILLVLMNSFKGKNYLSTEPFAFPNATSFVGFDNYIEGAAK